MDDDDLPVLSLHVPWLMCCVRAIVPLFLWQAHTPAKREGRTKKTSLGRGSSGYSRGSFTQCSSVDRDDHMVHYRSLLENITSRDFLVEEEDDSKSVKY